jgi:hypothetical protein
MLLNIKKLSGNCCPIKQMLKHDRIYTPDLISKIVKLNPTPRL